METNIASRFLFSSTAFPFYFFIHPHDGLVGIHSFFITIHLIRVECNPVQLLTAWRSATFYVVLPLTALIDWHARTNGATQACCRLAHVELLGGNNRVHVHTQCTYQTPLRRRRGGVLGRGVGSRAHPEVRRGATVPTTRGGHSVRCRREASPIDGIKMSKKTSR